MTSLIPIDRTTMRNSNYHGTGLFPANDTIKKGEEILAEAPFLVMPSIDNTRAPASTVIDNFFTALRNLDAAHFGTLDLLRKKRCSSPLAALDKSTFKDTIQNPSLEIAKQMCDLFFTVSHPFTPKQRADEHRLFRKLSFLNHSCLPNAELHWIPSHREMVLRACANIPIDQEILISYINTFLPREKRHSDLGFQCVCRECREGKYETFFISRGIEIAVIEGFRAQYFPRPGDMEVATPELLRAIMSDPHRAQVRDCGHNFVRAMRPFFTSGLCSMLRVADFYQTMYVFQMAWLYTQTLSDADKDLTSYSAFHCKLMEYDTLAASLGTDDPRSKVVMDQITNIVDKNKTRASQLLAFRGAAMTD